MQFQKNQKTFVIAEIGANHNGDIELAKKMIDVAKEKGADAVKFQSWDTTIFSRVVYEKNYFLGDDYRHRSDYTLKDIVKEFAINFDELKELNLYSKDVGILFSTTPFNVEQLNQLLQLDPPYIKVASMDLTNPDMLTAAGESKLPVILSTGFGSLSEIDRAVSTIEKSGNCNIVILHCVALYPPEDHEVNLNNIDMLRDTFGYPVGFSDHTLGFELSLAAIAKGSIVLEKHFTLDKEMFGWDHKASATPGELDFICRGRDRIYAALGQQRRTVGERETARKDEYRRSVVACRDINVGTIITRDDLDFRRPGTGIEPFDIDQVLGKVALRDITNDSLIDASDIGTPTKR